MASFAGENLTASQRDWVSSTWLPLQKVAFHRKDEASIALFQAVCCALSDGQGMAEQRSASTSTVMLVLDTVCCQQHVLYIHDQSFHMTLKLCRNSPSPSVPLAPEVDYFVRSTASAQPLQNVPRAVHNRSDR